MRQKMTRQFCQMESLNTTSKNASSLDLWRIEEASISHLVCLLCISEVFGRTFVKETSLYYVILLVKVQGVLLLRMDLWRTPGASLVSDKV